MPTTWLGKWWGSGDDPASGTTATPIEFLLNARFTSWSGHDYDIKDSGGKLSALHADRSHGLMG